MFDLIYLPLMHLRVESHTHVTLSIGQVFQVYGETFKDQTTACLNQMASKEEETIHRPLLLLTKKLISCRGSQQTPILFSVHIEGFIFWG